MYCGHEQLEESDCSSVMSVKLQILKKIRICLAMVFFESTLPRSIVVADLQLVSDFTISDFSAKTHQPSPCRSKLFFGKKII